MSDAPSGIILDEELPISRLARALKMREIEVLRRARDLFQRVRSEPARG